MSNDERQDILATWREILDKVQKDFDPDQPSPEYGEPPPHPDDPLWVPQSKRTLLVPCSIDPK